MIVAWFKTTSFLRALSNFGGSCTLVIVCNPSSFVLHSPFPHMLLQRKKLKKRQQRGGDDDDKIFPKFYRNNLTLSRNLLLLLKSLSVFGNLFQIDAILEKTHHIYWISKKTMCFYKVMKTLAFFRSTNNHYEIWKLLATIQMFLRHPPPRLQFKFMWKCLYSCSSPVRTVGSGPQGREWPARCRTIVRSAGIFFFR